MVEAYRQPEAVRDREAHIGARELGEYRAVNVLDHRVHDRLRVHDDLDPVDGDAEERGGLEHLKSLVHECRGIDRDLGPHRPRGVVQGVGLGRAAKLVEGPPAKRSPRGREQQSSHVRVTRLAR